MASSHANIQFSISKIERKIVHAESSGIIHVGELLSYFAWPVPVTLLRVCGSCRYTVLHRLTVDRLTVELMMDYSLMVCDQLCPRCSGNSLNQLAALHWLGPGFTMLLQDLAQDWLLYGLISPDCLLSTAPNATDKFILARCERCW